MEDLHMNNTSQKESFDYSNIYDYDSNNTYDNDVYTNVEFIQRVVTYIIISVGLPLILVAIYALYCQVRDGQVAPIYVINLLITDIIQLCCLIVEVAAPEDWNIRIAFVIHTYILLTSVGFMVCVALERYLAITCPLWYRFRRTIKTSVVVCVVVWVFSLVFVLILYFC
ncbi:G-protein coupled receptor 4, partial [Nibea albiflora]